MTVTATTTLARQVLKEVLQTEFAAEQFPVIDDHLHESLGADGTVIATSPDYLVPQRTDAGTMDTRIKVQFYGLWDPEIDPTQRVDPAKIEGFAERFMRALQQANSPSTPYVWFFTLDRLTFPHDPTGNKTRFEAFVIAKSNNPVLVETTG